MVRSPLSHKKRLGRLLFWFKECCKGSELVRKTCDIFINSVFYSINKELTLTSTISEFCSSCPLYGGDISEKRDDFSITNEQASQIGTCAMAAIKGIYPFALNLIVDRGLAPETTGDQKAKIKEDIKSIWGYLRKGEVAPANIGNHTTQKVAHETYNALGEVVWGWAPDAVACVKSVRSDSAGTLTREDVSIIGFQEILDATNSAVKGGLRRALSNNPEDIRVEV